MFNTLFDRTLDDFIYGSTCTEKNLGHDRKSEGTISNLIKNKVKIPQLASGALITGIISLSSVNSFGTSLNEFQKNKGRSSSIIGFSARPIKIGERERIELVKKLIQIREEFALTQEDLAMLLNISKSTISKMERGEHSPDMTNYAKYKNFLELSDYLKDKFNKKKYAIRQLFNAKSPIFDELNPIEFSHIIGDEGLNEVIYIFKRQYG